MTLEGKFFNAIVGLSEFAPDDAMDDQKNAQAIKICQDLLGSIRASRLDRSSPALIGVLSKQLRLHPLFQNNEERAGEVANMLMGILNPPSRPQAKPRVKIQIPHSEYDRKTPAGNVANHLSSFPEFRGITPEKILEISQSICSVVGDQAGGKAKALIVNWLADKENIPELYGAYSDRIGVIADMALFAIDKIRPHRGR